MSVLHACTFRSSPRTEKNNIGAKRCLASDTSIEDREDTTGFCSLCRVEFLELMELRRHKRRHNQVSQDMTRMDTPRIYKVYQQSQDNIKMRNGAKRWVRSWAAVDYMGSIMRGWIPSPRHELFLDENERSRASATDLSRLYRISNLGLLEENVEEPIIRWIENNVFLANSYRIERQ